MSTFLYLQWMWVKSTYFYVELEIRHLPDWPVKSFGQLRCIILTDLTFEVAFAYILNTDNKHLRPGCGSLNLLTSGPVSFQLQPLVFEMQNNPPPPKTTLWFVSLRQWSCTSTVCPEGTRVFGQRSDPCFIFHCCTHFIDFPVGWTGHFLTLRCDGLSNKLPMSARALAQRRLGFQQKKCISVKLLH